MSRLADAHHFAQLARDAGDLEILSTLIGDMAREMGFRHFILGHHFDSTAAIPNAVVIHNYPDGWAEYFTTHQRSEEHTSELQSLMRISYAVFCLKKKNNY